MRYVTISTLEELLERWFDTRVPNMCNSFIESNLDECKDNGDGTYTASYETFVITEPRKILYLKHEPLEQDLISPELYMMPTGKPGEYSYMLEPGEYLIHPKDTVQ